MGKIGKKAKGWKGEIPFHFRIRNVRIKKLKGKMQMSEDGQTWGRNDASLYTCRTLFTRLWKLFVRPSSTVAQWGRDTSVETLCSIRETIIGREPWKWRVTSITTWRAKLIWWYFLADSPQSIVTISFSRFYYPI